MSWFGGGGKSDNNGGGRYEPESSYQEQNYVGQQEAYAAPRTGGASEQFQQELLMEQQKALIQAVMFRLTDTAFKKCITNPSKQLSSSKYRIVYASICQLIYKHLRIGLHFFMLAASTVFKF